MNRRQIALVAAILLMPAGIANATEITFGSRVLFDLATGAQIVDTYSAAGYTQGDFIDGDTTDIFTDAGMSAVFNETQYMSTGFSDWNFVEQQDEDANYCAGCNGSFRLGFTNTSIGNANGVYGVGFDYLYVDGYSAFVTFGDNSTASYTFTGTDGFFGLISTLRIQSIHIGAGDGSESSIEGQVAIDNLTLAAEATTTSEIPEPASLLLLGTGMAALAHRIRRRPSIDIG
jgi:hypothetical protein